METVNKTHLRLTKKPFKKPWIWQLKPKKRQREEERNNDIIVNNMILLKHLMEIASTKRVDDGVRVKSGRRKKVEWRDFLEQILNMRRQQLEKLKADLEAQLARERAPSQVPI